MSRLSLGLLILAVLAASCATPPKNYIPSAESTANISAGQARRDIRNLFGAENRWSGNFSTMIEILQFTVRSPGVEMTIGRNTSTQIREGSVQRVAWKEIGTLEVRLPQWAARSFDEVQILPNRNVFFRTADEARRFSDALFVLKRAYASSTSTQNAAWFDDVATKYRAPSAKPGFPEEARRFRVQAEAAVAAKEIEDAADMYEEALKIVPWWPEGRFNRALILGELKDYGEAVTEMKRYLLLVPDAANARAAQDQIYRWESAPR